MGSMFFVPSAPELAAVSLPNWLELVTVVVGSFAGTLAARKRGLDLVGFIGLALICGLGGGLIRDTIMQQGGVYMLSYPPAIPVACLTALAGFFVSIPEGRARSIYEWLDIVVVGLFAATGTDKALVGDLAPLACILMGVLTGTGGGMLRDVFLGDVPQIFRPSNLYATCAVAGSAAYWLCAEPLAMRKVWAAVACVAVTVALRRLSLRFDVVTPGPRDLFHDGEGS